MSDDLDITPLGAHGGKRPGSGRPRKGEIRAPRIRDSLKSQRMSRTAYVVARLARDANDGCREAAVLLAGVRDNLISPYTAGCEMNYFKRVEPNGRGSENQARSRDWALHKLLTRPSPKALIG